MNHAPGQDRSPETIRVLRLGDFIAIAPHLVGFYPQAGEIIVLARAGRRIISGAVLSMTGDTAIARTSPDQITAESVAETWRAIASFIRSTSNAWDLEPRDTVSDDTAGDETSDVVDGLILIAYAEQANEAKPESCRLPEAEADTTAQAKPSDEAESPTQPRDAADASDGGQIAQRWALVLANQTREGLFARAGVDPDAIILVRQGLYYSLLDPVNADSPAEGTPVPDSTSPLLAPFVFAGNRPATNRAEIRRRLAPGPQELLTAVGAILAELDTGLDLPGDDGLTSHRVDDDRLPPVTEVTESGRRTLLRMVTEARRTGTASFSAEGAAGMLFALRDQPVRDQMLFFSDLDAPAAVWSELIRHAPRGWIAPVACLLAVTDFRRGHGLHARMALEVAIADQPDYELALLLREVIAAGISPGLLFRLMLDAIGARPPTTGENDADTDADTDAGTA